MATGEKCSWKSVYLTFSPCFGRQWVKTQRNEKKRYEQGLKTAMTDEKLQHLSDLDFDWGESNNDAWNRNFESLVEFKQKHGHCRIPRSTPKLGLFVHRNRRLYRASLRGESHVDEYQIHEENTSRLKAIGLFDDIC